MDGGTGDGCASRRVYQTRGLCRGGGGGGLAGEGADDVVRFVAGIFEDRETHGFAIAANVGELNGEILGEWRTLSFVGGEKFVAEGGSGDVVGHAEIVRLPVFDQLANHVGEEKGNVGGHAGSAPQAHGHGSVEGAEDVAHGVYEEEALGFFGGHWDGPVAPRVGIREYIKPPGPQGLKPLRFRRRDGMAKPRGSSLVVPRFWRAILVGWQRLRSRSLAVRRFGTPTPVGSALSPEKERRREVYKLVPGGRGSFCCD